MDDPVRRQYEAYPYPARDPREEAARLVTGSPSHLAEVDHFLFAGRRDFDKPFRALVAGGGTGDAAIMLAQHLADRGGPGEVVHLDLSASSRAVAEARGAARGLSNITFVSGAIEDLPGLGLGAFDYVDCCGVLHHLEDPPAALSILRDALAEGGGMGLMVYGEYGRTGVYPLQTLLRSLRGDLSLDRQVDLTRRVLSALPASNWFRRNPFLGDHARGDAELVDLFLHSRDRAYTVPQLAETVATAGLEIVGFIEPARYDPASYLSDPALLDRMAGLSPTERAALAEILAGNMKKHIVYVAPAGAGEGRIAGPDPEAVPRLSRVGARRLAESLRRDPRVKVDFDGILVEAVLPAMAPDILAVIDGRATLREIHADLQNRSPGLDWFAFQAAFAEVQKILGAFNLLWLSRAAGG